MSSDSGFSSDLGILLGTSRFSSGDFSADVPEQNDLPSGSDAKAWDIKPLLKSIGNSLRNPQTVDVIVRAFPVHEDMGHAFPFG